VLGALPRVPGLAGLVTAGRTPPLRSGPLVDRRGRPGRRLAGTLVPQPTVTVEGRDRRLDEVLGEGWAELRRSGPGAVVVRRDGAEVPLADAGLDGWLARAGARCAVVRPDRVVAAAR
jgi:3-(3-hydroxy-phenyl)propionate hydroxylase